jgi:hypothetical protein
VGDPDTEKSRLTQRISRTARGAFAALVAAGLTLGSSAALASASADTWCQYDPATGRLGLTCSTHAECATRCRQVLGEWSDGFCGADGCCICAF